MAQDIVQKINDLLRAGDFATAQKRIRPLAKKEPRNAGLQNIAGICHARGESNELALPYFANATKLAPQNVDFRCNLTLCLVLTNRTDQARSQIARLLAATTNDPRPHHYNALLSDAASDYNAVIHHTTQALAHAPDMADALSLRARAHAEMQQPEAALQDYRQIVSQQPKDIKARKALAMHLSQMGERDAALAEYNAVLAQDPLEPFALVQTALLGPEDQLDQIEARLQHLEDSKPRDKLAQVYAALARANLNQRRGDTEGAMVHFSRMHALDAKGRAWKPKVAWAQFDAITRSFPPPEKVAAPPSHSPIPIFIVGQPRSGTTLVERILSIPEGVAPCGELRSADVMAQRHLDFSRSPAPEALSAFADGYRAYLPPLPAGTAFFTDKMPANFRYIGPLLAAFPNARVINVERDPRDVALSMWMRRFPAPGMAFTNRMDWIADQANLYRAYIQHWTSTCSDAVLTIAYEDLVRDMQSVTQRMAAHCGIDWTDAMLTPEAHGGQVRTASAWQVRQKVHDSSVGGWQRHAEALSPMIMNLEPALWPELVARQ